MVDLKQICMVALVLVSVITSAASEHHSSWDYAKNGPATWEGSCLGHSQSPINIVMDKVQKSKRNNRVFSHNYWKSFLGAQYTMKNNGHALQIDLPPDTPYKLKKGQQSYTPLQVHIHFDPVTGKGSEHTVNSKKYFAEIHIVHRNSKYTAKKDIMGNKDGLLVIGIFVDLVKGSSFPSSDLDFSMRNLHSQLKTPNDRTSFAMQLFGKGATRLQKPGTKVKVESFPLAWLLPQVSQNKGFFEYVNYKGSLTTPPCSEIVDWIVITGKTLQVNEKTAKLFEGVMNGGGTLMAGNNRPVQGLYGRKVYGMKGRL